MRAVHIGCSGWAYRDWRGVLYPDKLPQREWLRHYASEFETVEVNNTFYRLPSLETVNGWLEQTPEGFLFAVKASRYLTHIKRLRELGRYLENFLERIAPLRNSPKLGAILWQFPATFERDDERLRSALAEITKRTPGRHAFEFRHESWFAASTYELLREHGAALVIADAPERPFQTHELTADWTYVRLHYGARGRRGNYSERELDTWARRIAAWRANTEVFVYMNNDWEGFAIRNARFLRERLG